MAGRKIPCVIAGVAWALIAPALCRGDAVTALEIYAAAETGNSAAYSGTAAQRVKAVRIRKQTVSEKALRKSARKIAYEYGIPPRLYEALVQFESGFNPVCRGGSGEYGLAQVMPETGRWLVTRGQIKSNWWQDPIENLRAGAVHLKNLKDSLTRNEIEYARRMRYKTWGLLLAQYNGGKGRVGQAVRSGGRLPPRLEWYIRRVAAIYDKLDG